MTNYQTFTTSEGLVRFSFEYPEGWEVNSLDDTNAIANILNVGLFLDIRASEANDFSNRVDASMTVISRPYGYVVPKQMTAWRIITIKYKEGIPNVQDVFNHYVEEIKGNLSYKILKRSKIEVAGNSAYQIDYIDRIRASYPYMHKMVLFAKNEFFIFVEMTSEKSIYDTQDKVNFEHFINSLQIIS